MHWKLTDSSWQEWRDKNPEAVAALTAALAEKGQQ
jgi:ABC-type nitrate/sulfonate/bicarbonate transport system substrate-binding protein